MLAVRYATVSIRQKHFTKETKLDWAKAAAMKWTIAYKSFFLLLAALIVPWACLAGIILNEECLLNGQNALMT